MRFSEKDHLAVEAVEKLLNVELDEWQRRVLLAMFATHAPEEPAQCTSIFQGLGPGTPLLRCEARGSHEVHRSGPTTWNDAPAPPSRCNAVHENGDRCTLRADHVHMRGLHLHQTQDAHRF